MIWVAFVVSFLASIILIPLVRWICIKRGFIATPRKERWHSKPTATLGGVGIVLAFCLGLLAIWVVSSRQDALEFHNNTEPIWGLLIGSFIVFIFGLIDDIKPISPPAKLAGQLFAAAMVVSLGFVTDFFTTRIDNITISFLLNVLITIIWIVGITNAINLLDNMDGLAGGISLIAALILSYLFFTSGSYGLLAISIALAGSVFGFLFYNFPPASIFMGDSGSQFLGFTLAVLAIARQPQASNVFAVLGVPTLLFLLPILDTGFVTFTRLLRGQSPVEGGSDHTSHRLIAFGLTERQTVFILYSIALISGIAAITIEAIGYWLSLVLVPILVISLALFAAYLGGVRIIKNEHLGSQNSGFISRLIFSLTYRQRILEIGLDIILISISYYIAFLIQFGVELNTSLFLVFLKSVPFVIVLTVGTFIVFGVYQGIWRYIGLNELLRYFIAVVISVVLSIIAIKVILNDEIISIVVFVLYGLFLVLSLIATRTSFRVFEMASVQLRYKQLNPSFEKNDESHEQKKSFIQKVIIVGVGNSCEMALRWLQMNPQLKFEPIGILSNEPSIVGKKLHGVNVIGEVNQIQEIIGYKQIDGVILTESSLQSLRTDELIKKCAEFGCWVRIFSVELELADLSNR